MANGSYILEILNSNLCRMVVSGYKKSLVEEDLWNLNQEDRSQHVVPKFEANWNKEMLNSQRYVQFNATLNHRALVFQIIQDQKPTGAL